MRSSTKKNIFFFFIIFLLFGTILIVFNPFGWSPSGLGGKIYITSGDIVKNFQFDSIDGESIGIDGFAYDNKLVVESEPVWTVNKEDVELMYSLESENIVYLYYKVPMTQKFNIYTNVQLDQGAEKLEKVKDTYTAGTYRHVGCWGGAPLMEWDADIYWEHYDFGGGIKEYNQEHNTFSGNLEMSFDIQQTPLPDIFQDEDGRDVRKKFDYIAVSSAAVTSSDYGKLSDDIPDVVGLEPKEYEDLYSSKTEETYGEFKGYEASFNPNTQLTPVFESDSFDAGIQPHTIGASLNPTERDGSPIWDPKTNNKSMSNCMITYRLGSLSPIVTEYSQRLSWVRQDVQTNDVITWLGPIPTGTKVILKYDTERLRTETESVALHIINRYIQVEIKNVFNIWTAYEVEPLESEAEDYDLDKPQEYYDDLTWSSVVDGFGGGEQKSADVQWFSLSNIITMIIIIGGIAIGLYVFKKIGIPYIRKKMGG